jgi:hypothetical protein
MLCLHTLQELQMAGINFKAFDLGGHEIARRVWKDYYAKASWLQWAAAWARGCWRNTRRAEASKLAGSRWQLRSPTAWVLQ